MSQSLKTSINFDILNLKENVSEGSPIEVFLEFPAIDHPVYGQTQKLQGSFPLLLPFGKYKPSNFFSLTKEEQEKMIKNTKKRWEILLEDFDENQSRTLVIICLIWAASMCPTIDCQSPHFATFLDTISAFDLIDNRFDSREWDIPMETVYSVRSKLREIDYSQHIPEIYEKQAKNFPIMEKELNFISKTIRKMDAIDPNFAKDAKLLCNPELLSAIYDCQHSNFHEDDIDGPFSEFTVLEITALTGNLENFSYNVALAYHKQKMPKCIQESLYFKLIFRNICIISRLINEAFGLKKDLDNPVSQYADSRITRKIIREDYTLEQAFVENMKTLNDYVRDTKIASRILIKQFQEYKDILNECLQVLFECQDGLTLCYVLLSELNLKYKDVTSSVRAALPAQNKAYLQKKCLNIENA